MKTLIFTLTLLLALVGLSQMAYAQNWQTISQKADTLTQRRDFKNAVVLYEEALSLVEKEFGRENEKYLIIRNNLGRAMIFIETPERIEPFLLENISFCEKLDKKSHFYARALSNMGEFYCLNFNKDNISKSEDYLKRAISLQKEILGEKHQDYAITLKALGNLYSFSRNFSASETIYKEVMQIFKETLGEKHPNYVSAVNGLAVLYLSMGNYSAAEILFKQVKQIRKETLGENHISYANVCNDLGYLYQEMGKYTEAEELYVQSKNIKETILGTENDDYARTLFTLGSLYTNMKKYDDAEPYLLQSKDIRERLFGKRSLMYGYSVSSLARLYTKMKKYDKAELLYHETDSLYLKTMNKEHPDYINFLNSFAIFYIETGDYAKAENLFVNIKNIKIRELSNNTLGFSERELKEQWASNRFYFENFYNFCIERCGLSEEEQKPTQISKKNLGEWLDLQLEIKGFLANGTQKIQEQVHRSADPKLIETFEKWKNMRTTMANAYHMKVAEREKQGLDMQILESQTNELEKNISRQVRLFAQAKANKMPKWTDLRSKLKDGEIAVEIVKVNYDENVVYYTALIISPKTIEQPEIVVLKNGIDLEKNRIKIYRDSAKLRGEDKESYGHFWKPIWEKIQALSPAVKKVYYSPDGVYNQLNINTLLNPISKKYVLEEVEIHQLGNLREVLALKSKTSQNSQDLTKFKALLIGRPKYKMDSLKYQEFVQKQATRGEDNDPRGSSIGEKYFSELFGTEIEVKKIDTLLRANGLQTETHFFEQATEERIKTANNPQIVHIATHGFFLERDTSTKFDDPMLRSGIVLAGISNYAQASEKPKTEDGVLTAQEAQSLDFDHTELVVLSACETGLGDVSTGEGVYGLQRALKVSGAKTLIMSLWKVNDFATKTLMSIFYENWLQKKQSKRLAFQNAQNTLRAMPQYQHFNFWGAFVMIGE